MIEIENSADPAHPLFAKIMDAVESLASHDIDGTLMIGSVPESQWLHVLFRCEGKTSEETGYALATVWDAARFSGLALRMRRIPTMESEKDFEANKVIHRGTVRFTASRENGEIYQPAPSHFTDEPILFGGGTAP